MLSSKKNDTNCHWFCFKHECKPATARNVHVQWKIFVFSILFVLNFKHCLPNDILYCRMHSLQRLKEKGGGLVLLPACCIPYLFLWMIFIWKNVVFRRDDPSLFLTGAILVRILLNTIKFMEINTYSGPRLEYDDTKYWRHCTELTYNLLLQHTWR